MRKYVSLFSGAMGLDLGLEQAGFSTRVCVENMKEAVQTIKFNRPEISLFDESVTEVTGEQIREAGDFGDEDIPLLVGGPPCQAFSVFGKREGLNDPRGRVIYDFVRLVDELQPKAFLMENVRGLLSMALVPKNKQEESDVPDENCEKGSLLKDLISKFNDLGYNVDCFVVNSVNYGAPQIRERVLLIGNRYGYSVDMPQPMYSNRPEDNLPPFKTLGDVIGPDSGFTDEDMDLMNFSPRKLKYLAMIPEGGNWRSLPEEVQKESMGKSWYLKGGRSAYWRKLSFSFPSPTVVTMPNHAGTSMCHPTELRAISVAEAAAIQEFPQDWKFQGKPTGMFRQIGNAVPVRLGKIAGEVLHDLLEKIDSKGAAMQPICSSRIVHVRPHVRTRTYWKNGESFSGDVCYYENEESGKSGQLKIKLEA